MAFQVVDARAIYQQYNHFHTLWLDFQREYWSEQANSARSIQRERIDVAPRSIELTRKNFHKPG